MGSDSQTHFDQKNSFLSKLYDQNWKSRMEYDGFGYSNMKRVHKTILSHSLYAFPTLDTFKVSGGHVGHLMWGRWSLQHDEPSKMFRKVDQANEDHCGCCEETYSDSKSKSNDDDFMLPFCITESGR